MMKLVNFSIFFLVVTNFCMEENSSGDVAKKSKKLDNPWKKIQGVEDIKGFVGKLVAYPAYDLEDLIQLKNNPDRFVTYAGVASQGIWLSKKNKKFGLVMLPLIKKRESMSSAFVAMNIRKHKGNLYMRLVTSDELLELKKKFESKEIEFDDYEFVLLKANKSDKSVLPSKNKKANL